MQEQRRFSWPLWARRRTLLQDHGQQQSGTAADSGVFSTVAVQSRVPLSTQRFESFPILRCSPDQEGKGKMRTHQGTWSGILFYRYAPNKTESNEIAGWGLHSQISHGADFIKTREHSFSMCRGYFCYCSLWSLCQLGDHTHIAILTANNRNIDFTIV
jgi:hypothetical protein